MDTIVMKLLALVSVAAVGIFSQLNNILLLGRLIPSLVQEIEKYDDIQANSHTTTHLVVLNYKRLESDDG